MPKSVIGLLRIRKINFPNHNKHNPVAVDRRVETLNNAAGVNSRVPKTVRHGTSLHIICPKLWIDSSPSRLESQTYVRRPTAKIFGSSPIQLESQASVHRPTPKLFGSSPSQLESPASVRQPSLKLFGSSPSRLSFD